MRKVYLEDTDYNTYALKRYGDFFKKNQIKTSKCLHSLKV